MACPQSEGDELCRCGINFKHAGFTMLLPAQLCSRETHHLYMEGTQEEYNQSFQTQLCKSIQNYNHNSYLPAPKPPWTYTFVLHFTVQPGWLKATHTV